MTTRSLALILLCLLGSSHRVHAGLVISLDPTDLTLLATGGVVLQDVDLFISHDGNGSNLFSEYEISLTPNHAAVVVLSGPIATSDFSFDLVHGVSGNAPGPYVVTGGNLFANQTVNLGGQNLLARIQLSVDTAVLAGGTIDLAPSFIGARRGGFLGSDISGEFSVQPAQLTITTVPEPSSLSLLTIVATAIAARRLKRLRSRGSRRLTNERLEMRQLLASDAGRVVLTDPQAEPPSIESVLLRSPSFTPRFAQYLGQSGQGHGDGFMRWATEQSPSFPWPVDAVRMVFSEDVDVRLEDLLISGVNQAERAPLSFQYNPDEHLATWIIPRIGKEQLRLNLSNHIQARATGKFLDGNVSDGNSDADAFNYRFSVLAGDLNGDGFVTISDLNPLRERFLAAIGDAKYDPRFDANADGFITMSDLDPVRANFLNSRPNAVPLDPRSGLPLGISRLQPDAMEEDAGPQTLLFAVNSSAGPPVGHSQLQVSHQVISPELLDDSQVRLVAHEDHFQLTLATRPDRFGNGEIELSIVDGQGPHTARVPVHVLPVNDPPRIVQLPGSWSLPARGTLYKFDVSSFFADVDDATLNYRIVKSDAAQVAASLNNSQLQVERRLANESATTLVVQAFDSVGLTVDLGLELVLPEETQALALGDLALGVIGPATATGEAFLLVSGQAWRDRLGNGAWQTNSATHVALVRIQSDVWQVFDGQTWLDFTTLPYDRLLARIDMGTHQVELLEGQHTRYRGIAAGYYAGDLTILPEQYGDLYQAGAFHVVASGLEIFLAEVFDERPRVSDLPEIVLTRSVPERMVQLSDYVIDRESLIVGYEVLSELADANVQLVGRDSLRIVGLTDVQSVSTLYLAAVDDQGQRTIFTLEVGVSTLAPETQAIDTQSPTIELPGSSFALAFAVYSDVNLSTLFEVPSSANPHFAVAKFQGDSGWQVYWAGSWRNWKPGSGDRIVSVLGGDDQSTLMLSGVEDSYQGIAFGYNLGNLQISFVASPSNSPGSLQVSGSWFSTTVGAQAEKFNYAAPPAVSLGSLGEGLELPGLFEEDFFILYSQQAVQTRLASPPAPSAATNLLAVRFYGSIWQYANRQQWLPFQPASQDRLLASYDTKSSSFEIMRGVNRSVEGIAAGFLLSDLQLVSTTYDAQGLLTGLQFNGRGFVATTPLASDDSPFVKLQKTAQLFGSAQVLRQLRGSYQDQSLTFENYESTGYQQETKPDGSFVLKASIEHSEIDYTETSASQPDPASIRGGISESGRPPLFTHGAEDGRPEELVIDELGLEDIKPGFIGPGFAMREINGVEPRGMITAEFWQNSYGTSAASVGTVLGRLTARPRLSMGDGAGYDSGFILPSTAMIVKAISPDGTETVLVPDQAGFYSVPVRATGWANSFESYAPARPYLKLEFPLTESEQFFHPEVGNAGAVWARGKQYNFVLELERYDANLSNTIGRVDTTGSAVLQGPQSGVGTPTATFEVNSSIAFKFGRPQDVIFEGESLKSLTITTTVRPQIPMSPERLAGALDFRLNGRILIPHTLDIVPLKSDNSRFKVTAYFGGDEFSDLDPAATNELANLPIKAQKGFKIGVSLHSRLIGSEGATFSSLHLNGAVNKNEITVKKLDDIARAPLEYPLANILEPGSIVEFVKPVGAPGAFQLYAEAFGINPEHPESTEVTVSSGSITVLDAIQFGVGMTFGVIAASEALAGGIIYLQSRGLATPVTAMLFTNAAHNFETATDLLNGNPIYDELVGALGSAIEQVVWRGRPSNGATPRVLVPGVEMSVVRSAQGDYLIDFGNPDVAFVDAIFQDPGSYWRYQGIRPTLDEILNNVPAGRQVMFVGSSHIAGQLAQQAVNDTYLRYGNRLRIDYTILNAPGVKQSIPAYNPQAFTNGVFLYNDDDGSSQLGDHPDYGKVLEFRSPNSSRLPSQSNSWLILRESNAPLRDTPRSQWSTLSKVSLQSEPLQELSPVLANRWSPELFSQLTFRTDTQPGLEYELSNKSAIRVLAMTAFQAIVPPQQSLVRDIDVAQTRTALRDSGLPIVSTKAFNQRVERNYRKAAKVYQDQWDDEFRADAEAALRLAISRVAVVQDLQTALVKTARTRAEKILQASRINLDAIKIATVTEAMRPFIATAEDRFRVLLDVLNFNEGDSADDPDSTVPFGDEEPQIAAPFNLAVSDIGRRRATLTWQADAGATGFSVDIERMTPGGWQLVDGHHEWLWSHENKSVTFVALPAGEQLRAVITAKLTDGRGVLLGSGTSTIEFSTKPYLAPTITAASSPSSSSVRVDFQIDTDGVQEVWLLKQTLVSGSFDEVTKLTLDASPGVKSLSIVGTDAGTRLDPGQTYSFKLAAVYKKATMESGLVDITVRPLTLSGVTVDNITAISSRANWPQVNHPDVTEYRLLVRIPGTNTVVTSKTVPRGEGARSSTLEGLNHSTAYDLTIEALVNALVVAASNRVAFTTAAIIAPANVVVDELTQTSLRGNWNQASGIAFSDYRLVVVRAGTNIELASKVVSIGDGRRSSTMDGLPSNTAVEFFVQARLNGQVIVSSARVSVITYNYATPSTPTISNVRSRKVDVNWSYSGVMAGVDRFEIRRDNTASTVLGTLNPANFPNATSFTKEIDRDANARWWIFVRVFFKDGTSRDSALVQLPAT